MSDSSKLVSQAIIKNLGVLSKNAVDRQYALQPELWNRFGQSGIEKSLRDSDYHFSYLAVSLDVDNPVLFLDYIAWVKVLFAGLKFPISALTAALDCMILALRDELQPDLAELACATITSALEHLPNVPETPASYILPDSPQFELAVNYLEALMRGDRHTGSRLILDAVDQGTAVKDIYLHVFQPSQREIGRLWQMNKASVAQEHYCTVATQMIMSQLYPHIFASKKNGRRMVATSVGDEFHEIGVRMVADFLELDGWDTYYLGANTPTESVIRMMEEHQADVVAISATISYHVGKVADLIKSIHSSSKKPSVKILVGGHPFNIAKELWKEVGADGYAPSALDAVAAANQLVEKIK